MSAVLQKMLLDLCDSLQCGYLSGGDSDIIRGLNHEGLWDIGNIKWDLSVK